MSVNPDSTVTFLHVHFADHAHQETNSYYFTLFYKKCKLDSLIRGYIYFYFVVFHQICTTFWLTIFLKYYYTKRYIYVLDNKKGIMQVGMGM